jgi:ATP phosphoribosyltransferase regulatory subunit HisZ
MVQAPDLDAIDETAAKIRSGFSSLRARRVQVPATQPLQPYLDFMGETYRQRIVEFDSGNDDAYCLCPDYTLALALEMAQGRLEKGNFFYDDVVFRGDQASSGKEVVHRQVGVELFGEGNPLELELSLIRATLAAVHTAGVKNVRIVFADVGLIFDLIDALPLHPQRRTSMKRSLVAKNAFQQAVGNARLSRRTPSALVEALSSLPPGSAAEAVKEIIALSGGEIIGGRTIDEIAERMVSKAEEAHLGLTDAQADELHGVAHIHGPVRDALKRLQEIAKRMSVDESPRVSRWEELITKLSANGIEVDTAEFEAGLGRGFSFYDGIVFELYDARSGMFLGGGGRYDGLLEELSHGRCSGPAIGAMLRPDRVAAAASRSK